jgi:hypothetical protein
VGLDRLPRVQAFVSPVSGVLPADQQRRLIVGIGTSLLLIAVGAILRFAVSVTTSGFNIHTVGVILMIVGGVGLVISMFFWSSWGGFGGYGRERRVVRDGQGGYVERERDV